MKKFTVTSVLLLCASQLFAQTPCVPGTIVGPGNGYIVPDSATNFANACPGTYYEQILYIKAPKDTAIAVTTPLTGVITADIDSFVFDASIVGMPTYLNLISTPVGLPATGTGDPKNDFVRLVVPGDSLACVSIGGMVPVSTPAATLPLSAKLRVYLSNMHSTNVALELGIPTLYPGRKTDTVVNLNYYKIVVYPTPCWPTAIENIKQYNFDLIACTPNPAHSQAQISFESKFQADYQFAVINALGEMVLSKKVSAESGLNYININTSNLANGMYMYTLSDGKNKLSKKFEVNN